MASSNPSRDMALSLLREHGAVLVRSNKHEVWRLPNGQKFTRATTPSDYHADDNNLSDLRELLGLVDHSSKETPRTTPKTRKSGVYRATEIRPAGINTSLRDQLASVGLIEESLRGRISGLNAALRRLQRDQSRKRARIARMFYCRCWWCRAVRWMRSKMRPKQDSGAAHSDPKVWDNCNGTKESANFPSSLTSQAVGGGVNG